MNLNLESPIDFESSGNSGFVSFVNFVSCVWFGILGSFGSFGCFESFEGFEDLENCGCFGPERQEQPFEPLLSLYVLILWGHGAGVGPFSWPLPRLMALDGDCRHPFLSIQRQ